MYKLIKILLSWLALFALASGSMSLTGCSKEDKDPNLDLVKYDLRLNLDEESIKDQELKTIAFKINNQQQVSHNLVSKKFQEMHAVETETSEVSSFIKEISADLKNTDYFARKTEYEKRIETKADAPLLYNKRASSVSHIISENRMQCYSGTSLNLMVSREVEPGQTYESQNYVVILQAGHVLPGKMIKAQGQWALIGIESTSTGVATHYLGLASELEYGKVRVVDASFFILIEMYKKYLLSPTSAADTALELTAKKYGINLQNYGSLSAGKARGRIEGKVRPATTTNKCESIGPVLMDDSVIYAEEPINKSPFGFGCSTVTDEEDKVRTEHVGIGSSVSEVTRITLQEIQWIKTGKPASASQAEEITVLEKNEDIGYAHYPYGKKIEEPEEIYSEDHGVDKEELEPKNKSEANENPEGAQAPKSSEKDEAISTLELERSLEGEEKTDKRSWY